MPGQKKYAASLKEAIELCEQYKKDGTYNWFRGQVRDFRPLNPSLIRVDAARKEKIKEKLNRFGGWAINEPALKRYHRDYDALFAIAQHHGLPTLYMDFTTEPKVAGF